MFRFRLLALLAAVLLVVGGVSACAEPPSDDGAAPAADDAAATGAPEAPAPIAMATEAEMPTEAAADDRPIDASGCRPSSTEVLDSLTVEAAASGATIGQTGTQLLDVDDMIYGTWEVNAASVTTTDGTEEVAVWVTKVVPPGQWSSSAAEGAVAYSVNDVAAELSTFEMATADVFGREVLVEDADVMAALTCLE